MGIRLPFHGTSTVEEIERAIEQLEVKDPMRLLQELPSHLHISTDDAG